MARICPNCGSEMKKYYITEGNALFLSTVKTTYKYFECPNCDYKTDKEIFEVRKWWDGSPSKEDTEDD